MPRFSNGPYGPVAVMDPERAWVPKAGKLSQAMTKGYAQPSGNTGFVPPAVVQQCPTPGTLFKQQQSQTSNGQSAMLSCSSLDQWQSSEADSYQGLRVARPIDRSQWQFVSDQLSATYGEGLIDCLEKEVIDLEVDDVQRQFRDAAKVMSQKLEPGLAKLVSQDAQALADATHKLLPQAKQLIMKLELFGSNGCFRWHQDHYVCRSIVSYNCSATDYTEDSNVDFFALRNRGDNDAIIHDKRRIHYADVGDLVMIKGLKYPGTAKGLVHRSPEMICYNDGRVQTRLILKVDILDLCCKLEDMH